MSKGSDEQPYIVTIGFNNTGIEFASCTCPYDWGGWCKQIVATLLEYHYHPKQIPEKPPITELLDQLDPLQWGEIILNLCQINPEVIEAVERMVDQ
ncbi:MAG: hypothetical protein D6675_07560 [Gemmatimonadetes bacterium]|nr:MAG: hypothetical protein D6675_07560 [Gemmatimonadota bacterium]